MPSLRKLAQLAGVNPSTVTRALRDDPRIGQETRRRIQSLAEQYHYLPNRLTQSLMTGRSNTIGIVLPSVVTPYSARLLAGVLQHAATAGYRVIIRESQYQLAHSLEAIQMLIEQRMDGVLLDCGHLEAIPRKVVLELRSQRVIPVGLDATNFDIPVDHVHTDEEALAVQAVDYLVRLGHQRIAFVGKTVDGQLAGRGHFVLKALQQRLLPMRYFFDTREQPPYNQLPTGALLDQILSVKPSPTAIIAWEDPIAAILLKEAGRHGLRVPRDLSILGFGNLAFSSLTTPTLTTFEQHPEIVGQQAFDLLLSRLNENDSGIVHPPKSIAIRPTLVKRESCALPPNR
ncbi:MAG: LacI family DNA-binding transcriptional regulator [Armatimonadota bacterium]